MADSMKNQKKSNISHTNRREFLIHNYLCEMKEDPIITRIKILQAVLPRDP